MATDAAELLIVEDDSDVREALGRALKLEGYGISLAADGQQALHAVSQSPPDLIVLDVSMPGLDGLGVARALRAANDRTPVLMLTARDAVQDRVMGLNAGADDYLVKPFALAELVARINALLRRATAEPPADPGLLSCGDLVLDLGARQLRRAGHTEDLTKIEFDLLELLLRNAGRVVTRELIRDRVWGYDGVPGSNSMEVFISVLRRKTEPGGAPRVIHTVRGVGYTLRTPS
ncbi:response regulator transcription factor [Actinospica durhamensis]|uniref:Response regulator transcription factor n=1 Tax=Actinospica durhamensis TaxID=1508375 RepID=A0A941IM01_9ACTN|nr:response regulator transcription factor [Actinospica durhamensis]MBR7832319.1 response regulator transcription factor [Actinospica durhamensis]